MLGDLNMSQESRWSRFDQKTIKAKRLFLQIRAGKYRWSAPRLAQKAMTLRRHSELLSQASESMESSQ